MTTANVIALKGQPVVDEQNIGAAASDPIYPGTLLEYTTTVGQVYAHLTAANTAAPMFALELTEQGKGMDDAYTLNSDRVRVGIFRSGDRVAARVADTVQVRRGYYVESAGDGTVREVAASAATSQAQRNSVIGIAMETVTGSGTAGSRIDIMII